MSVYVDNYRAGFGRMTMCHTVAEWLGVSEAWVRAHASGRRSPKLPYVKLGGCVRFDPAVIEAWIREMGGVAA